MDPENNRVDTTNAKGALRLAFSYHEAVESVMSASKQAVASGEMDASRVQSLRGFYEGHMQRAERQLHSLRELELRRLSSLEHEVEAILHRQSRLSLLAATGKLAPEDANSENRVLVKQLRTIRRGVTISRENINAKSSGELGGFIRMDLDEYAQHLDEPQSGAPSSWLRPMLILVSLVVAAGVILTGGLYFSSMPLLEEVSFEVEPVDSEGRVLEVVCRNDRLLEIFLHIPWPEERIREESFAGPSEDHYGIEVHVQEKEGGPFRLLPYVERGWSRDGMLIREDEPIFIASGLSAKMLLHTESLSDSGVDAVQVKIVFVWKDGQEVGSYVAPVPRIKKWVR